MNDQELKDLWQKQKTGPAPASSADATAQIKAMQNKMTTVRNAIKARNKGELLACVFIVVVFSAYYFIFTAPISRAGSLIVIAGSLLIAWRMARCRHETPQPDPTAPVGAWLKQERERVHYEAELLRTVLWWYILPLYIGSNVFLWGFPKLHIAMKIAFTAGSTLLNIWVYRINQTARKRDLLRVQDELQALLQNESDSTTTPAPSPTASTNKKQNWLTTLFYIFVAIITVCVSLWISHRNEPTRPRPPAFTNISAFTSTDIAQLDAWLQDQLAASKFPSLSVAIVREGKLVYTNAFGFADIATQTKATPQTPYHVASVTKAFTASIAAMLHTRGVIDLDHPVANYLPKEVRLTTKPAVGSKITLRQLASHTSGLPRTVPGAIQSNGTRYDLDPALLYKHLANITLEFEPGAGELYSNFGFGLLGHALERATGKPFDQLLQETLCTPLHLDKTTINENGNIRAATGYSSEIPRRAESHSFAKRFASSGGLITTATDLANFLAAQMTTGFFTAETLQQLHTPTKLSNGANARTALGWTIRTNKTIGRLLEKNGGRNNCGAWIGFSPEHKVGVVILTNCGAPDIDPLGAWLLERSILPKTSP